MFLVRDIPSAVSCIQSSGAHYCGVVRIVKPAHRLIKGTTIRVKRINIDWHHVQEFGTQILSLRGGER